MLKNIYSIIFISTILSLSLNASVYKGHGLFKKQCLSCHGKALEFVIAKKSAQWKNIMKNNGSELLLIHVKAFNDKNVEEQKALEYFKGKRFPKNVRHYEDFFLEYAADTGNIPACD